MHEHNTVIAYNQGVTLSKWYNFDYKSASAYQFKDMKIIPMGKLLIIIIQPNNLLMTSME